MYCNYSFVSPRRNKLWKFVIFKPLSYYFEETVQSGVKASFARRLVSCLIKLGRILRKGYSIPRDFSWIENYKTVS